MEEGDGKGFWMVLFLFVVLKNKQTKKTTRTHKYNINEN